MKRIGNFLLEACAISVIIVSVFFIFAKISSPEITPAVSIGKYFLILLFSVAISGVNMLFSIQKLHKIASLLIHYAVTIISFMLIFVSFEDSRPMRIFVLFVFFTILYAAIFAVFVGVRKLIKSAEKKAPPATAQKKPYKSLYKD